MKDGLRDWKQGDMLLAGQESRARFDLTSDVGIRGFYLSLTLSTAKFKRLDQSYSLNIFVFNFSGKQ